MIYQVDQQLDGDEPDEVPDGEEGVVGPGAGHRVVGVLVVGDVRGRRRRPASPAALATCGKFVQPLLLPLVPLAAWKARHLHLRLRGVREVARSYLLLLLNSSPVPCVGPA